MEIRYQNTAEDYRASFEAVFAKKKNRQRDDYYRSAAWYLTVLALGAYVSTKHDEYFISCVFVTLAMFYLWQNWSFEKRWRERADEYVNSTPKQSCSLQFNAEGLVDVSSDVVLKVPWNQLECFDVHRQHIFIQFASKRNICIPFRDLEPGQRQEIVALLESHKIPKRL